MPTVAEVQAYWDRLPCSLLHSPAKVGTKEFYDQLTERKYYVQPHVKTFAEFEKWKDKKVLEIGCGLGTDAEQFARAGAIYTGVDVSATSLVIAQNRFLVQHLNGQFYQANVEELTATVPVERYDLVYAFGVLHHTPAPVGALSQLKAYMDDSSELRVMLYAEHSWKAAMIDAGLDQSEAQANCPVAYRYTREQAVSLLSEFDILKLWQDHIFPFRVREYKQYQYLLQPWFDSMSPEMFRALEAKLGWHMLIWAKRKPSCPLPKLSPTSEPMPSPDGSEASSQAAADPSPS